MAAAMPRESQSTTCGAGEARIAARRLQGGPEKGGKDVNNKTRQETYKGWTRRAQVTTAVCGAEARTAAKEPR